MLVLQSNLYSAKRLSMHRIPAAGVWPHDAPPQWHAPLGCRLAHPSIPLPGAMHAATVKYAGYIIEFAR
jgi:hypothetical protein